MHQQLSVLVDEMILNGIGLKIAVQEFEAMYIQRVLNKNNNNVSITADQLGVHRNTLARKIENLSVDKTKRNGP